jgi:hypothetical protein
MPSQHPYYTYLSVYYGEQGESPRKSAFYVPKYGDNLSKVASSAYGLFTSTLTGVQRINRSLWNIQAAEANAFNYRQNSISCKSKVVDPRRALTTQGYNDGAWLALCPPYPLFWIPGSDGEMPEDLAPPDAPIKTIFKAPPSPKATFKAPGAKTTITAPKATFVGKPGAGSPYTQAPAKAGPTQITVAKAGFSPWWLLLLLAAGGGYLWYRSRKKKRKKR